MNLLARLRTQDGVVTHEQALEYLSRWAISRRVESGQWSLLFPRVYADAARPLSVRGRIRAVALWAGDEAVVSGVAAAVWWSMHDAVNEIEVCVPPRCTRASPPGVRFVRRVVRPEDRRVVGGLAVTTRAVTALDAAVALGGSEGRSLLDRALQERLALVSVQEAHARRPRRRGARAAAALLHEAADRTASEAERRTNALLLAAGLVGCVNYSVRCGGRMFVIDIAFPDQKVAIEVRGWAYHSGPEAFVRDPRRKNLLTLDGWLVLEVTWDDIVQRPQEIVAEVRAALRERGVVRPGLV